MAWKHKAGHKATLDLIKSCVASGTGIESLDDAPCFSFVPASQLRITHWSGKVTEPTPLPLTNGPPSKRGSIACGKAKPKHIKNWNPSRLDADPMYSVAMAGDSPELTKARQAWADGDPEPLREWLAGLAQYNRAKEARRIARQQREKENVAA